MTQTALQRAETMDPASLSLLQKSSSHTRSADDGASGMQGYQTIHNGDASDAPRPRRVSYSDTVKKVGSHPRSENQSLRRRNRASSLGDTDTPSKPKAKASWAKQAFRKFHSLELENKGSVARDHLALGMSHASVCHSTACLWRSGQLGCMSRGGINRLTLSIFSQSAHF